MGIEILRFALDAFENLMRIARVYPGRAMDTEFHEDSPFARR
jgi:hypothetical protein